MQDPLPEAQPEVLEAILGVLRDAQEPVPRSRVDPVLRSRYGIKRDAVGRLLQGLVAAGRIFEYAPLRGSQGRYSLQDPAAYCKALILRQVAVRPVSLQHLARALRRQPIDPGSGELQARLDELERAGRVFRLPPPRGGRTLRYSAQPPEPGAYLQRLLDTFLKGLAKEAERLAGYGVAVETTRAAAGAWLSARLNGADQVVASTGPAPPAMAEAILSEIRLRDKKRGGLVSVRELRQTLKLAAEDKPGFDQAVLELARQGRVWLYRHDYPASLTQGEREALVSDGRNFYNGISVRE
ncbi:MAG: hypothetical protein ACREWG_05810 [Gammaproteobacteria bacterium]